MAREICKMNLVVVEENEETTATGNLEFAGTGADIAQVFAHLFAAFDLDPVAAYFLSQEAIHQMKGLEEEE